jgi:ATP-dependent DNA ligase
MGSQDHPRYSHKALKAIREARDAGRVDEAKEALRTYDQQRRKKKLS